MTRFKIDTSSPVPAYKQVKNLFTHAIITGSLKEGDRLPPIRLLAKTLKLNPNTLSEVYYRLGKERLVQGRTGSSFVVKSETSIVNRLRSTLLEKEIKRFLKKAGDLGFRKEDIETITRRYLSHD